MTTLYPTCPKCKDIVLEDSIFEDKFQCMECLDMYVEQELIHLTREEITKVREEEIQRKIEKRRALLEDAEYKLARAERDGSGDQHCCELLVDSLKPKTLNQDELFDLLLGEWEDHQLDDESYGKPYQSNYNCVEHLEDGRVNVW